jgi:cytochrome c553
MAPPLAGQQSAYLLRQLENFHLGRRGDKADAQAQEMQQILTTVADAADWQSVIAYIATCASCHGKTGEGNESLDAPSFAGLPGWYIVAQLRKFSDGTRGAVSNDGPGSRMRAIATTLRSDEDITSVTAYIVEELRR